MNSNSKKALFPHQESREYRGQRRVQDYMTRANRVKRRAAKQALGVNFTGARSIDEACR